MFAWLLFGYFDLSFWQLVVVALVLTHLTIASVTIYLHRAEAHRALVLSPALAHVFRFWLWLTTGMKTKEWVAVHRKHHAHCETPEDPHSPKIYGIWNVLFKGMLLYKRAAADSETLLRYGKGTPDDALEERLYVRHPWLGIGIMATLEVFLFGLSGLLVLAIQLIWIPFWAAGVINGVGHFAGYRTHDTPDMSTNIVPFGIVIGGEELHNNHHAFPASAKFSLRWYECDIAWGYIRVLAFLGLLSVKRATPVLSFGPPREPDEALLRAIVLHRYAIVRQYAAAVRRACRSELEQMRAVCRDRSELSSRRALMRLLWSTDPVSRSAEESERIATLFTHHPALAVMDRMRTELRNVWAPSHATHDELIRSLHEWCARAEESRITALERFSRTLRRMSTTQVSL